MNSGSPSGVKGITITMGYHSYNHFYANRLMKLIWTLAFEYTGISEIKMQLSSFYMGYIFHRWIKSNSPRPITNRFEMKQVSRKLKHERNVYNIILDTTSLMWTLCPKMYIFTIISKLTHAFTLAAMEDNFSVIAFVVFRVTVVFFWAVCHYRDLNGIYTSP